MNDGLFSKAKTRENIEFRPLDDKDSTDSETEVCFVSEGDERHVTPRPWLIGADSTHSSTSTVFEDILHPRVAHERDPNKVDPRTWLSPGLEVLDPLDYSNHEADTPSGTKPAGHGSDPNWIPRFLRHKAQHHTPQTNDPRTTYQQENPSDSQNKRENPMWQTFWRDVNEKIQHKETPRIV